MVVIAGKYGGRTLQQPKSEKTRPMSHKVRGALFDSFGPEGFNGVRVLDAYAGSGALGIEALSRGALYVDAIEAGMPALAAITANQTALGLNFELAVHGQTVEGWLAANQNKVAYDIILADPPYAQLKPEVLEQLSARLAADGVMVLSHSSKVTAPVLEGCSLRRTKRYGDSSLSWYHRA